MKCYRCGALLEALTLPFSRMDACPSCAVDLHVCRMCVYFDPGVPRQCREDDANEVKLQDKARANFCDYFKPNDDAFDGSLSAAEARAKDQLASLFGEGEAGRSRDDDSGNPAEKLFK